MRRCDDVLECGAKTLKYSLFLFNLVFVICGLTLIILGVIIKSAFNEYSEFLDDKFFSAPSLLITTGTIIFFIAFFGCCGAINDSHCKIMTYSILVGAIFVMELVAGVTGYMLSEETSSLLRETLRDSMNKYNGSKEITIIWDTMQSNLHCCGATNYTEWIPILHELPVTCCNPPNGALGSVSCTVDSSFVFKDPCIVPLGTLISDYSFTLGAVATGVAFIQIIGVVFACFLAAYIRRNNAYESV